MSPWLLRIEMARDMMVDKKLLLSEVSGCWLLFTEPLSWHRPCTSQLDTGVSSSPHHLHPPTHPTALPGGGAHQLRVRGRAALPVQRRQCRQAHPAHQVGAFGHGMVPGLRGCLGGEAGAQAVAPARADSVCRIQLCACLFWTRNLHTFMSPNPPTRTPDSTPVLDPRLMTDEGGKGDDGGGEQEDDVFLKKIEASMLTQVGVGGVGACARVCSAAQVGR